jgi:hypothetical protein
MGQPQRSRRSDVSIAGSHAPAGGNATVLIRHQRNVACERQAVCGAAGGSNFTGMVTSANSVACAANIMRPDGTTKRAPDQRSRCRAIPDTGSPGESPSSRKSNMATLPTSVTNPAMCTISTIG